MKTVSFTALTAKTKLLTSVPAAMGLLDYKISSDGRGGDAIVTTGGADYVGLCATNCRRRKGRN